jgi:hypothetical protein
MKTVEELKILANDLNNECSHSILRFKVMNNKIFGTGIYWIGTWGHYGGFSINASGVVQGYESDEDFVIHVKRCSQEVIEDIVKEYKEHKDKRFLSPKFVSVMEQYIKNN